MTEETRSRLYAETMRSYAERADGWARCLAMSVKQADALHGAATAARRAAGSAMADAAAGLAMEVLS